MDETQNAAGVTLAAGTADPAPADAPTNGVGAETELHAASPRDTAAPSGVADWPWSAPCRCDLEQPIKHSSAPALDRGHTLCERHTADRASSGRYARVLDAINAVNASRQGGIDAVIGLLVGVTIAVIWSLNEAPAGCQPSDFGFDLMNITFRCAGEGPIIVGVPNTPSHPISLAVLAFVGTSCAIVGYLIEGWLRPGQRGTYGTRSARTAGRSWRDRLRQRGEHRIPVVEEEQVIAVGSQPRAGDTPVRTKFLTAVVACALVVGRVARPVLTDDVVARIRRAITDMACDDDPSGPVPSVSPLLGRTWMKSALQAGSTSTEQECSSPVGGTPHSIDNPSGGYASQPVR